LPRFTPKTEENTPKAGKFAPNKKWAVSPLISPPAGAVTANLADKFVCILSIGQNAGKFNGKDQRAGNREQGTEYVPQTKKLICQFTRFVDVVCCIGQEPHLRQFDKQIYNVYTLMAIRQERRSYEDCE
jgi:hypothetical protein